MARGENKSKADVKRPKNCGECRRFEQFPEADWLGPDEGYCDEWPGVRLRKTDVCHPNVGILKHHVDGDIHNDKTRE